tara:strand:- start:34 stop:204 length:171 start_codon:yes stop_codon:yes gene_type:complete
MTETITEAFARVRRADENGWLEDEIRAVCDTYSLDETKDRNKILLILAEQRLDETR